MIIKHCAICGKEFKIYPCREKITKCCSYKCRNESIRRTKTKTYQANTTRTNYIQDVCILNNITYNGHKVYI